MNDLLVSTEFEASILVLSDWIQHVTRCSHSILLNKLENWFGISGVLKWLKFHFTNHPWFVLLGSNKSYIGLICHGVPQGPVSGPLYASGANH